MIRLLSKLSPDVGIDLGTANTPVCQRNRGICWNEPSYLAVDKRDRKVLAIGQKARRMQGRVPAHIQIVRPVRDGAIADYEMARVLLNHALQQVRSHGVIRPRVLVGVPADATDVECQAVSDAVRDAGARAVQLLPQPLLAAIGAGLAVQESKACMIVDVGGGSSQAAVVSAGSLLASNCIRAAGDRMDAALVSYLRHRHNLIVGERSAEELKMAAGAAMPCLEPVRASIAGRDLHSGLPRSVVLDGNELAPVLSPITAEIAQLVKSVLESTPPDQVGQVMENGLALCGGGSLLRGLDEQISQVTGVRCQRVPDPMSCVALGAARLFSDPRLLRMVLGGYDRG